MLFVVLIVYLSWSFLASGGRLEAFWAPAMACCVLPVSIWSWVPKCAISGDKCAKKMLNYDNCSIFGILCLKKSFYECYGVLTAS